MRLRLPLAVLMVSPVVLAVDFATEIHPILSARCAPCHSGTSPQAQLLLTSRDGALRGGVSGPAIVPGKPDQSLLFARVTSAEAVALMPPTGGPLKPSEIDKLRLWIEEGALWPDMQAKAASKWEAPIALKKPVLPTATGHPVDVLLEDYFKRHGISPPQPVADAQFARRAYFDIWGLPPTPAELDKFVTSTVAGKRAALVRELLADAERYSDHWVSYWNDLLRNDIGVVYYGERKSITGWLQSAIRQNMPYDAMLKALLNPAAKKGPEGFLVGVNWRGDINASQTPFMQASQNTAQIFLGINLKCASCHDSFINKYRLSQAYGLAAFFSTQKELELVRCDMKTGKLQKAEFLYPEVSKGKSGGGSLKSRHKAAAKFFTSKENGRTPRTIVNRYWRQLLGRGLVEPVDEMDNEPWDPALLDWLAADLEEHKYDLKHLIERIMTSAAYQLPTHQAGSVFQGPAPRRITAEQFIDTASAVTGEWRTAVSGDKASYVREWKLKSSALTRALGRPIRDQVYTTRDDAATTFQALELANGSTLGHLLRRGARRLLGELPPAPSNAFDSKTLRRGAMDFDIDISDAEKLWLLAEDAGSYDSENSIVGWANVQFLPTSGEPVPLVKAYEGWQERAISADKRVKLHSHSVRLGTSHVFDLQGKGYARIRGQFVIDDNSRQSDINAAARFFLFTKEPDRDQLVRVAGKAPVDPPAVLDGKRREAAVQYLFRAILGRDPITKELQIATDQPLDAPALEDLLWTLLMHTEFQYLP